MKSVALWLVTLLLPACITLSPLPLDEQTDKEASEEQNQAMLKARSYPPFVKLCLDPKLDLQTRLTVEQIRSAVPVGSCIQAWDHLQKMEKLDLTGLEIVDLSPLASFTQLKVLLLSNNHIEELTPLMTLKQLEQLSVSDNSIKKIAPLQALKNLKYLDLSHNKISELEGLGSLLHLQWLDLCDNQLTKLPSLKRLSGLWYLAIAHNQIEVIEPLAELTQLKELYLQHNKIRSLRSLVTLKNLEALVGEGNPLVKSPKTCPQDKQAPLGLREYCSDKDPSS